MMFDGTLPGLTVAQGTLADLKNMVSFYLWH